MPPTHEAVEEFLQFTDRDPNEVLGVILPDSRAATIWSIAVNGVMAGCRPEYMPVLIAAIEGMCDAKYGVEHSGNTPGGETLIIINGPIIKQLGFNYTQGALRDGFQANTSIGRVRYWIETAQSAKSKLASASGRRGSSLRSQTCHFASRGFFAS